MSHNFAKKETARSRAVIAAERQLDGICDRIDRQIREEEKEKRIRHRIGVLYPPNTVV